MANLPIESNNDAMFRTLSGARFAPNTKVILPSGEEISGAEATAFASAFRGDKEENVFDPSDDLRPRSPQKEARTLDSHYPLSSAQDRWTGDPAMDRAELVGRAQAAMHYSLTYDSAEEPEHRQAIKKPSFWRRVLNRLTR